MTSAPSGETHDGARPIEVRRLRFRFDADVPFQWNRGNPWCGNLFNIITFIGPAFERYFIRSVTKAMPRIRDERVRREARLFCEQEGQHALHHVAHLRLLNERHPGLDRVHQEIAASYDALFERSSLEFNLAYMASVEMQFTPFAVFVARNVERLFGDSDPRIASFMLWHMAEEFEHRRCAGEIYDDVVGDWWLRIRSLPATVRHLNEVGAIAVDGMKRCVPAAANPIPHDETRGLFRGTTGRLALARDLLATMLPGNGAQDGIDEPEWIRRWFADAAGGSADMTLYYPRPA
jgi:predicted metal-dependent hydrolase